MPDFLELDEVITAAARDARRQSGVYKVGESLWSGNSSPSVSPSSLSGFFSGRVQSLAEAAAYAHALQASLTELRAPNQFREEASLIALECERLSSRCRKWVSEETPPLGMSSVGSDVCIELHSLAALNGVQGCVKAGFRAARSRFQADNCEEGSLRPVFEEIAGAEIRHADLFIEIQDWLVSQLSPQRARDLEDLRLEAILDLRADIECFAPDDTLVQRCGMPSRDALYALLDALEQGLWSGGGRFTRP